MHTSRRHLSYANVTATLALVFAMSGGALAAKHYLINSLKQISPNVQKALKGNTGPAGEKGPAGKEGSPGKEGLKGLRGPSNGYQAFKDNVGSLSFTEQATVGTLAVPAGSYLVSAKLWVRNTKTERLIVECSLVNDLNGDKDESSVTAEQKGSEAWYGHTMVVLQAASTLPSSGHWLVKCQSSGAGFAGKNLKIHAVQVESLSNTNA
jgi:hypothetical protein